jgi:hypothetical protein
MTLDSAQVPTRSRGALRRRGAGRDLERRAVLGDPWNAVLCMSKATHAVTLASKTKFLV